MRPHVMKSTSDLRRELRKRREAKNPQEWPEGYIDLPQDQKFEIVIDGATYRVKIEWPYDDDPDMSWMGKFTDKPKDPAWCIDHHGKKYGKDKEHIWDYEESRWFEPANSSRRDVEWFRAHGYSRHNAWLQARQQLENEYQNLCRLHDGDLNFVGCKVEIKDENFKIVAEDSCWGFLVGFDNEREYLLETQEDMLKSCIGQVQYLSEKLKVVREAQETAGVVITNGHIMAA